MFAVRRCDPNAGGDQGFNRLMGGAAIKRAANCLHSICRLTTLARHKLGQGGLGV